MITFFHPRNVLFSPYSLVLFLFLFLQEVLGLKEKEAMFSFEKTSVYLLALEINRKIYKFLKAGNHIPPYIRTQFGRASLSLMLNIAEGSGKFSQKDRKNFLIISRASLFECVSILQFLYEENEISQALRDDIYNSSETLSRKLYYMIKRLES